MVIILLLTAVGLLTAITTIGYATSGHMVYAIICMLLGLSWAAVDWFGVGRSDKTQKLQPEASPLKVRRGGDPMMDTVGLLLFTGLSAWGIWQGLPAWLMLIAVMLTLAAWDLGRFSNRLMAVLNDAQAVQLEKVHLARLGMALMIGLILGCIPLLVHIPLDFIWLLLLGVLAVIGLSRFARGLSR